MSGRYLTRKRKTDLKERSSIESAEKNANPSENKPAEAESAEKTEDAASDVATEKEKNPDSPQPQARSSSPDLTCAICLSKLENKSFTDSCFHQFCFVCLLEWSKVKSECPLCKQPFNSIIHNVRSYEDYDQYHIQNQGPPENEGGRRFRYRTTLSHVLNSGHDYAQNQTRYTSRGSSRDLFGLGSEPTSLTARSGWRRLRQAATSDFRRRIYQNNCRVVDVQRTSRRSLRVRDTSPAFFMANPACTHRLVPWLNRELNALLHNHEGHTQFLLELILGLITRYEISSEDFYQHTFPFIGRHTRHFMHEFENFAKSTYHMQAYDQHAYYETQTENIDSDTSSDGSDVMIIASPENSDQRNSENSRPPILTQPLHPFPNIRPSLISMPSVSLTALNIPSTSLASFTTRLHSPVLPEFSLTSSSILTSSQSLTQNTATSGWDSPIAGPSWCLEPPLPPSPGSPQMGTSQVHSEVIIKSETKPDEPVTIRSSGHSDSDSDAGSAVIFIQYDKPWEDRSPIMLSTDEEGKIVRRIDQASKAKKSSESVKATNKKSKGTRDSSKRKENRHTKRDWSQSSSRSRSSHQKSTKSSRTKSQRKKGRSWSRSRSSGRSLTRSKSPKPYTSRRKNAHPTKRSRKDRTRGAHNSRYKSRTKSRSWSRSWSISRSRSWSRSRSRSRTRYVSRLHSGGSLCVSFVASHRHPEHYTKSRKRSGTRSRSSSVEYVGSKSKRSKKRKHKKKHKKNKERQESSIPENIDSEHDSKTNLVKENQQKTDENARAEKLTKKEEENITTVEKQIGGEKDKVTSTEDQGKEEVQTTITSISVEEQKQEEDTNIDTSTVKKANEEAEKRKQELLKKTYKKHPTGHKNTSQKPVEKDNKKVETPLQKQEAVLRRILMAGQSGVSNLDPRTKGHMQLESSTTQNASEGRTTMESKHSGDSKPEEIKNIESDEIIEKKKKKTDRVVHKKDTNKLMSPKKNATSHQSPNSVNLHDNRDKTSTTVVKSPNIDKKSKTSNRKISAEECQNTDKISENVKRKSTDMIPAEECQKAGKVNKSIKRKSTGATPAEEHRNADKISKSVNRKSTNTIPTEEGRNSDKLSRSLTGKKGDKIPARVTHTSKRKSSSSRIDSKNNDRTTPSNSKSSTRQVNISLGEEATQRLQEEYLNVLQVWQNLSKKQNEVIEKVDKIHEAPGTNRRKSKSEKDNKSHSKVSSRRRKRSNDRESPRTKKSHSSKHPNSITKHEKHARRATGSRNSANVEQAWKSINQPEPVNDYYEEDVRKSREPSSGMCSTVAMPTVSSVPLPHINLNDDYFEEISDDENLDDFCKEDNSPAPILQIESQSKTMATATTDSRKKSKRYAQSDISEGEIISDSDQDSDVHIMKGSWNTENKPIDIVSSDPEEGELETHRDRWKSNRNRTISIGSENSDIRPLESSSQEREQSSNRVTNVELYESISVISSEDELSDGEIVDDTDSETNDNRNRSFTEKKGSVCVVDQPDTYHANKNRFRATDNVRNIFTDVRGTSDNRTNPSSKEGRHRTDKQKCASRDELPCSTDSNIQKERAHSNKNNVCRQTEIEAEPEKSHLVIKETAPETSCQVLQSPNAYASAEETRTAAIRIPSIEEKPMGPSHDEASSSNERSFEESSVQEIMPDNLLPSLRNEFLKNADKYILQSLAKPNCDGGLDQNRKETSTPKRSDNEQPAGVNCCEPRSHKPGSVDEEEPSCHESRKTQEQSEKESDQLSRQTKNNEEKRNENKNTVESEIETQQIVEKSDSSVESDNYDIIDDNSKNIFASTEDMSGQETENYFSGNSCSASPNTDPEQCEQVTARHTSETSGHSERCDILSDSNIPAHVASCEPCIPNSPDLRPIEKNSNLEANEPETNDEMLKDSSDFNKNNLEPSSNNIVKKNSTSEFEDANIEKTDDGKMKNSTSGSSNCDNEFHDSNSGVSECQNSKLETDRKFEQKTESEMCEAVKDISKVVPASREATSGDETEDYLSKHASSDSDTTDSES